MAQALEHRPRQRTRSPGSTCSAAASSRLQAGRKTAGGMTLAPRDDPRDEVDVAGRLSTCTALERRCGRAGRGDAYGASARRVRRGAMDGRRTCTWQSPETGAFNKLVAREGGGGSAGDPMARSELETGLQRSAAVPTVCSTTNTLFRISASSMASWSGRVVGWSQRAHDPDAGRGHARFPASLTRSTRPTARSSLALHRQLARRAGAPVRSGSTPRTCTNITRVRNARGVDRGSGGHRAGIPLPIVRLRSPGFVPQPATTRRS